ncbi:MAG: hypothetical protein JWN38_839 [Candidatus Saccharibacteria bacterium]|nr:hypothetical protein [Candidatus Saccharibacteria bacterium]
MKKFTRIFHPSKSWRVDLAFLLVSSIIILSVATGMLLDNEQTGGPDISFDGVWDGAVLVVMMTINVIMTSIIVATAIVSAGRLATRLRRAGRIER